MKKLLITGFEPFGGEDINPSWEAVMRLPDQIGEYALTKLRIPVVFGKAAKNIMNIADELNPDVIISVGQAGGRDAITPELVGINLRHASIPDNDGNQPKDEQIVSCGKDAYFSTLPVRRMAEAAASAGVASRVSYSAGAYVCNDVLYTLLSRFENTATRVGFIHIPYCTEQNKEPNMSLDTIVKGLVAAIENIGTEAEAYSMTNAEILRIAMEQSAADLCAEAEDFTKGESVIVFSRAREDARRYLKLPFTYQIVSYGNNAVASVSPEFREITEKYINSYPVHHLFETPNMQVINDALKEKGQKICFMAEYFLPDVNILRPLECPYELRVLTQKDFADLYLQEWSNALCESRKHLDVLGVGAYDGERLVGLAGCSADCDSMWQIGVDVLPEYRRQGIASAVTSRLATEILKRGKVPFYCAAWSNVKSARNAIKSGFRPAWVEMTAKSCELVDSMNKIN